MNNLLSQMDSDIFFKYIYEISHKWNYYNIFTIINENIFLKKIYECKYTENIDLIRIVSILNNMELFNILKIIPLDLYVKILDKSEFNILDSSLLYSLKYPVKACSDTSSIAPLPYLHIDLAILEKNFDLIISYLLAERQIITQNEYNNIKEFLNKYSYFRTPNFTMNKEIIKISPIINSLINDDDIVLEPKDYDNFIENIKKNIKQKKSKEVKSDEQKD